MSHCAQPLEALAELHEKKGRIERRGGAFLQWDFSELRGTPRHPGLSESPDINGSFQLVMGVPLYRWMVFVNRKTPLKWKMTRGTPILGNP